MKTFVGTSGFSYPEWRGSFYPEKLPAREMLAFYGRHLGTVELNATFYRMPKREVLEAWRDAVPPGFRFALKAPRRITHGARDAAGDALAFFAETVRVLGDRLGPILLQFPPQLRVDPGRLDALLGRVPEDLRVAVEVRHASWFEGDALFDLLARRGAALCVVDGGKIDVPLRATAPFGYLRLRRERYDGRALGRWARRLREAGWGEAFVYFKHETAAPALAAAFEDRLAGRARPRAAT